MPLATVLFLIFNYGFPTQVYAQGDDVWEEPAIKPAPATSTAKPAETIPGATVTSPDGNGNNENTIAPQPEWAKYKKIKKRKPIWQTALLPMRVGLPFGFHFHSFSDAFESVSSFQFLGLAAEYDIYPLKYAGSQGKTMLALYFTWKIWDWQTTFTDDNLKFDIAGREHLLNFGAKLPVWELQNAEKKIGLPLFAYFKLGLTAQYNTYGEVAHPLGPRAYEVASMGPVFGLLPALGASTVIAKAVEFQLELGYHLTFNEFQAERSYTFSALREKFTKVADKSTIVDAKSKSASFSDFIIQFSFLYRVGHAFGQ